MSERAAARLAWSTWVLAMVLAALGTLLTLLNGAAPRATTDEALGLGAVSLIVLVAFSTVGTLVASRRPANPIGWIFCAVGLSFGVASMAEGYARRVLLTAPGSLPGGEVMAWVAALAQGPSVLSAFVFLFLLFPTGRLLTPHWRPVAWLAAGVTGALLLVTAFQPGPLPDLEFVINPMGVDSLPGLRDLLVPVFLLLLMVLLASAVCLILRFRRSRGDERQQLKWFAAAGALLAAVCAIAPIIWSIPELEGSLWPVLFFSAVATIPVAAGIAILKYRLYDIDVIINRALVYGALTIVLALVYFVGVVLLQELFRVLTGQDSNLAIVIATLASAALFQPLRQRLQRLIDHRFYRRRYDAARTLAAFSLHVRDEVDLTRLTEELVAAVDETMQPAHVSLWVRRSQPPAPAPAADGVGSDR